MSIYSRRGSRTDATGLPASSSRRTDARRAIVSSEGRRAGRSAPEAIPIRAVEVYTALGMKQSHGGSIYDRRRCLWLKCVIAMHAATACVAGRACDIPVFQYALEFWDTAPYRLTVFHRGPLAAESDRALATLRSAGDAQGTGANLEISTVDLDAQPDASMQRLWQQHAGADTPWVVLDYPSEAEISRTAWSGPLTAQSAQYLIDSPARQEIARALLARQAAVWVLLESGARRADADAARLIEAELTRLEKTLRLPRPEAWGPADDEPLAEAQESFSMVRVRRDDPAEQVLIGMLLNSEPDLEQLGDQPIVFPIYGRGLILYALVGAGIGGWTITEAAEFVTGPCSCQVKALNPGTDLLLATNWDRLVERTAAQSLPPLTGMADFGEGTAGIEKQLDEIGRQVATGSSHSTMLGADGTQSSVLRHGRLRPLIPWLIAAVAGAALAVAIRARRKSNLTCVEDTEDEHLAT